MASSPNRGHKMVCPAVALVVVLLTFFATFVSLANIGQGIRGYLDLNRRGSLSEKYFLLLLRSIDVEAFEGDPSDILFTIINAYPAEKKYRGAVIRGNKEAFAEGLFKGKATISDIKEFGPLLAHSGLAKKYLPPIGKRIETPKYAGEFEYAEELAKAFRSDKDFVSYFLSAYQESSMIFDLISDKFFNKESLAPFLKTSGAKPH